MNRRKIFAGNWKMHKTSSEAADLVKGLIGGVREKEGREFALFVPSPYLKEVSSLCASSPFATGAQNMYHESQGAFTGEISPLMVKDCGARFILIGHSERRHIFHETDSDVNLKVIAALKNGIEPMICIGELLEEREGGETARVLETQVRGAFRGIDRSETGRISIAYEPVWAIGTGRVATPEIAEETHAVIRDILGSIYDKEISMNMPILYGGSVKPDNAAGLNEMENIDGFLVGGASLDVGSFLGIINI